MSRGHDDDEQRRAAPRRGPQGARGIGSHPLKVLPGALLLLALAAGPPVPAAAAPGSGEEGTWSVEESEEVRSRLLEADRLFGQGVHGRAVALLQEVLDRYPDHLVKDEADPLRYLGAGREVLRRIRALSPEARAAYAQEFGPVAERDLDRALRARDPAGLAEVGRRFLLTGPAGPRALLALADLRLARGEPGRAAPPLRTLRREFPGTAAGGPAVAARHARAHRRTGDGEGLAAHRASLGQEAGAMVSAGGREVLLSSILDEAEREVGPPRGGGSKATLGGGSGRTGVGDPVPVLEAPRWMESSPRFNWTDTDFRQLNRESAVEQSLKNSQPVVPCIVDGVVYFHWFSDVHARDLYTGRERWHFRGPVIHRIESARTHGSWIAAPAVRDGILYAPLMVWPEGERARTVFFAGQDIIPYIPARRLFALDAATGKRIWDHADPRPAGDPFADRLARIDTTSAPLVLGDLVIAAGAAYRSQFTAYAYAADRRTGEVRWVTSLGYGQQEQNLFGRPVKEIPVAAAASDGERVFVLSNMGIVSCLDPESGNVIWTRGYRQVEVPYYQTFWTTPERDFTFTGSPPVVSGGVLLLAPADAPVMFALEAATGKFLWSHPARDGRRWDSPRMTRLLAADDAFAYLAGTSVRALDLKDGRVAWERPFDALHQEECSGRGVLAGGTLAVPTNRALWVLDARGGGRVLRKEPWARADGESQGRAGGNLVSSGGAAVIARLFQIEGHFSTENVNARAAALLRDRPDDPSALLEAASAYLAADRSEEALPLLRRALPGAAALPPEEGGPLTTRVKAAIFSVLERRAMALVAGAKPADARRAFEEAARTSPDPADAAGLLLRGARALYDGGRFDLAGELVEIVVRDFPDAPLEEERHLVDRAPGGNTAASYALFYLGVWSAALDRDRESVEAMHRILERPDSDVLFGGPAREVARLFVDSAVRRRGPEFYAPFEEKAAAALEAARAAKDPAALGRVLRRWPNSRAGLAGALEAARLLLDRGDAAGAQAAARGVLALEPGDAESAAAGWILAEALAKGGKVGSARTAFQRLARRHPDVPVPTAEGPLPAAAAARRRLASPDLASAAVENPGLPARGPWRTLWEREAAVGALPRPLLPEGGPVTGRLLFTLRSATVSGVDAATGAERWSATHPAFLGTAAFIDGVLLFADRDEAVGVESSSGRLLWTTPLPGYAKEIAVSEGLLVLLLESSDDQDVTTLLALDPATGEPAWEGERDIPGGAEEIRALPGGVVLESWDGPLPMLRVADISDGVLRPFHVPLRRTEDEPPGELLPPGPGPLLVLRSSDLTAFDPRRGTRSWGWTPAEGTEILAVAAGPTAAAVLDTAGALTAVRLADGRSLWTIRAGEGRMFDPSSSTLLVDERFVMASTSSLPEGSRTRIEAHDLERGAIAWTRDVSAEPVITELAEAGGALVVNFLAAGPGSSAGTGVLVLDRGSGEVVDRLVEDRLAGDAFDTAAQAGVLLVSGEQVMVVRGR